MGNNHDKFFSTSKRKVLVVGLSDSGKSTLVQTLKFKEPSQQPPAKTDLEIYDIKVKKFLLCMFDLGGQDRQKIFWRQNFYGSQGIIFVIDATNTEHVASSIAELEKIINDPDLSNKVPIAIFMNKGTHGNEVAALNMVTVNKAIVNLRLQAKESGVKLMRYFEGSSRDYSSIMQSVDWLLQEMNSI